MKYGHKRHPMKPASSKDGLSIKIANYLGSQEIRSINAPAGVKIECDPENPQKEIFITGIDNESVGTCASLIHQSCRPEIWIGVNLKMVFIYLKEDYKKK